MYAAVVSTILGQALILGNISLLAYGGFVWLLVHAFVLAYEELTLTAMYASENELYCNEVPRWTPKFTGLSGRNLTSVEKNERIVAKEISQAVRRGLVN